jgi:hypothetical protein
MVDHVVALTECVEMNWMDMETSVFLGALGSILILVALGSC